MSRSTLRCRTALLMATLALLFVAADWAQFRGPGGAGVGQDIELPAKLTESNILWKTPMPGFGAASPIVVDDRVYVLCYTGYGLAQDNPGQQQALRRVMVCCKLDDGRLLGSVPIRALTPETNYGGFQALHGYASSTPASDGTTLFAFFGRSGVGALTLTGKGKWLRGVGDGTHGWGSGASPVLYENLVIVNASVESGAIVGLDQQTGREVWRTDGIARSWSTPALVAVGQRHELVVSIEGKVLGLDPATGERLWHCEGVQDYVCPSVVVHEDVAFVIGGRAPTALAVRAGGQGDVTESHRLWKINKCSNVSSPVYYDGHLYWVHDSRGTAYCVEADTGEVAYEQRLEPRSGKLYASPIVADGKLWYVSREHGIFVLPAEPEFRVLAHNPPLDDSIFNGSPAVADGRMLLRSDTFLYCLGK